MTDDELAQVITGNPKAKASGLNEDQLEALVSKAKNAVYLGGSPWQTASSEANCSLEPITIMLSPAMIFSTSVGFGMS